MIKFELPKTVRAKAQIVGALVALTLILGTAASLRTQHNLIALCRMAARPPRRCATT